jgi:hypothetical protein
VIVLRAAIRHTLVILHTPVILHALIMLHTAKIAAMLATVGVQVALIMLEPAEILTTVGAVMV